MPGEVSRNYPGPLDRRETVPAYFLGYEPGDSIWWHSMHREYGAAWDVRAFVVVVRSRLGIAAQMRDGSWVPRWVRTDKVTPRTGKEEKRDG